MDVLNPKYVAISAQSPSVECQGIKGRKKNAIAKQNDITAPINSSRVSDIFFMIFLNFHKIIHILRILQIH